MKPFLKEIVILGRNGKLRRIEFGPGVNIITGVGSKGKSAILHIFEYCLGATTCRIPLGKVRDFAAWFFLVLYVRDVPVIIGRRAPPATGQASDEAYFDANAHPSIPPSVEANASIKTACAWLAKHLNLPQPAFRFGTDEVVHGHVETSDLLPLLLQPQSIIATEELFLRTGRLLDKERWAEIVKIALGIISPELLALRAQRARLQKDKDAAEKRRREYEREHKAVLQRAQLVWQRGSFGGVVPDKHLQSMDDVRVEVGRLQEGATVEFQSGASNQTRFAELETQSQSARREINRIESELKQIARLRSASRDVQQSLDKQSTRLRVVDLLGAPLHEEIPCPLCGSKLGPSTEDTLAELRASLDEDLAYVRNIPPELDAAEKKLHQQLEKESARLQDIDTQLRALQQQGIAPTLTEERVQRERFIGAIMQHVEWAPTKSAADSEVDVLRMRAQIDEIDKKIHETATERSEVDVAQSLCARVTKLAGEFERLQLGDGVLAFDPTYSTIQRVNGSVRESLPVLGGAESFVMYHLCALLGLHEQFLEGSFVPPLLMIDQPSQTYFPTESDKKETDRKAVKAIYDLLFRVAERHKDRLQIIALDHADFSSEDGRFHAARKYDWHGEDGLIEED
ncbi:DUF3732 domain-containing protein [Polyangium jinanense]|uniref:DUF3732 domain-containing protein n=1 Tax=Polyangium jinanense TaxID=2829994 RepID=A0A9X3XB08_9BACT|nr:DUF3732 domain-containing protein [Polyangium jinanense]MDC3985930.1 DUF3732 domain-containing protein [Polyangium jinanense]